MIAGLYDIFRHWEKNGAIWLYSDPHFGDEELQSGIQNRPSDDEQVRLINSKVGKKDTLIILGDVGKTKYVQQLKGYKVLICGNHDAGASNYKRNIVHLTLDKNEYSFEEAKEAAARNFKRRVTHITEGYNMFHSPFEYWDIAADNKLFDEVYTGPLMIGERLLLSHEPIEQTYALNLHGHVHDLRHKDDKYHMNLCAEAINYTPVCLNTLVKSGKLAHIESIHRETIDKATERKKKRNG